jgi:type III secretory pathway lipoprotein EscJ
MRNWIDMFGKNILEVIPASERAKIIERIEQKLSSQLYQNDTWFVDYRRIRVIAKKKPSLEY